MRSNREIEEIARQTRERLGVDAEGPIDLFTLVKNQNDITLVFYPFPKEFSGLCIKKVKLIAINSTMTRGRQNFSLAHELYHLYFDENDTYQPTNIEINYSEKNDAESEANVFASHLLIPYASLMKELKGRRENKERLMLEDVIAMEQYFGVSHKAMLVKLGNEGCYFDFETVNTPIKEAALKLGYDTSLYQPIPLENDKATFGSYIHQANELYQKELISKGKYEEYLLNAFREDAMISQGGENGYD